MTIDNRFDELQREFFDLYNKLYNEELILKPNDNGDKSLWSASSMFDYTPLHIERSWGNLTKKEILNVRPNNSDRISEAIYENEFLQCVKYWHSEKLTGFANFEKLNNDIVKELRVVVDDEDQELARIGYFHFDKNCIIKSLKSQIRGVKQEEYEYEGNRIVNIHINERTSSSYIYDLPNGITNKPLRTIDYKVEYKNGEVSAIYNSKGENMYVKNN